MDPITKLKTIQGIYEKYYQEFQKIPFGGKLTKDLAKRLGIDGTLIPLINKTILYGKLRAGTKARLSIDEINRLLKDKQLGTMSQFNKEEAMKNFGYTFEKGSVKINGLVIDQLKKEMNLLSSLSLDEGMTKTQMKRALREVTKDNEQDFDMVIRSELMNQSQKSFAQEILEGKSIYSNRGEDTKVFKRPNPNACPHCKRLYLDQDGRPRVFKLKDLLENGSNVGRKVADWKPVVGITHPHCQCILEVLPENCILDEKGNISVVKNDKAKD